MKDSITVITATRERPELLKRAIASVRAQDYTGLIVHLVIVDDCDSTARVLTEIGEPPRGAFLWRFLARRSAENSGSARAARARNRAIQMAKTKWIAFLDDDNEYEPNHLSSLVACAAKTRSPAIHSHRKLYWADGTPYLESRLPWMLDLQAGKQAYRDLSARGVFIRGTNIMRDRVDPKDHPDPIRIVDTSEWLIERRVLMKFPFPEHFTIEDWENGVHEDAKLLHVLIEQEVPIATSGLATLKYYLGGYSNAFFLEKDIG